MAEEVIRGSFCANRYFFARRFLRPANFSIAKLSSVLPALSLATSQRGRAPRPAQVSPVAGSRYFGATFRPFIFDTRRPRRPFPTSPPPSLDSWVFHSSALRLRTSPMSSRSLRRASTDIDASLLGLAMVCLPD